jgi:Type IV secretion system proteins
MKNTIKKNVANIAVAISLAASATVQAQIPMTDLISNIRNAVEWLDKATKMKDQITEMQNTFKQLKEIKNIGELLTSDLVLDELDPQYKNLYYKIRRQDNNNRLNTLVGLFGNGGQACVNKIQERQKNIEQEYEETLTAKMRQNEINYKLLDKLRKKLEGATDPQVINSIKGIIDAKHVEFSAQKQDVDDFKYMVDLQRSNLARAQKEAWDKASIEPAVHPDLNKLQNNGVLFGNNGILTKNNRLLSGEAKCK